MTQRSIDGLKRRTDASRRTVGINKDTQKPLPRKIQIQETPRENSRKTTEITDFFNEVKDSDAKSLIGTEVEEQIVSRQKKERGKKKEKSGKPKSKKKKIILSVVGFLLLLIIGAGVFVYIQGNDFISKVTGGGNLWDVITADPNTPLQKDPESGRTNVLIFGTEGYSMDESNYDGGWLTDSIMVASVDQDSGDVRMLSLPRDLKSKTCTSTSKINELYYCTYSKNKGTAESRAEYEVKAAKSLAEGAEEVLGVKIQYFVHVNWQALLQIVDTLGGIDVVFTYKGTEWSGPEVAIETTDKRGLADYNSGCKCYEINFKSNEVIHLDGASALAVARARNHSGGWGASGGNFSREQFQQKILQAVALKAKKTNFATDFMAALKIKDAVGDNLRMDFKDNELKTLFGLAGRIDLGKMESISLQDTGDGKSLFTTGMLPVPGVNNLECGGTSPGCLSYVYPKAGVGNYSKIHEYVKKKLSNQPEQETEESADISVLNATTISGLASSEEKKLSKQGLYVSQATNAPKDLQNTKNVMIYKLSKDSFSNTTKQLEEMYGVKITTTIPSSLQNYTSDFVIVLGSGFSAK